jgi:hypothetical protein
LNSFFANGFDIISVWIEHEGRIVMLSVMWPWPRFSVRFAAIFESSFIELMNSLTAFSIESQMGYPGSRSVIQARSV